MLHTSHSTKAVRKLSILCSSWLIVCAVLLSNCGGSPTTPTKVTDKLTDPPTGATTGQVVIYTKATQGWNSIAVSVDDVTAGTLSSSATAAPSCSSGSSNNAVVLTKPAGNYTVKANSNGGYQWSGPVTVAAGSCNPVELTCPNGNCAITCLFSVTPTTLSITGAAGTSVVNVQASSSGCAWTASSNSSFLTVAPPSGTGSGSVIVAYSQNSGADRTGTITVAGQTITVNQVSTALEGMDLQLEGRTAFSVSSPEFPGLSSTCYQVANYNGSTPCLFLAPHGTYHFIATVPLVVSTGCDLLSADGHTCTVILKGIHSIVHMAGSF